MLYLSLAPINNDVCVAFPKALSTLNINGKVILSVRVLPTRLFPDSQAPSRNILY